MAMDKVQAALMGLSAGANIIPGIGQAASGLLAVGTGIYSLFKKDNVNLKGIYDKTKADISYAYDSAGAKLKAETKGIFDAKIGEVANKGALSGMVSGVANSGRLAASTYANVTEQRDQVMMNNERMIQQQKAGALQQAADKYGAQESYWEMNKPDFVTKALPLISALGDEGTWKGLAAVGSGLSSLLKRANTTVKDTPLKTMSANPLAGDVPTMNLGETPVKSIESATIQGNLSRLGGKIRGLPDYHQGFNANDYLSRKYLPGF